ESVAGFASGFPVRRKFAICRNSVTRILRTREELDTWEGMVADWKLRLCAALLLGASITTAAAQSEQRNYQSGSCNTQTNEQIGTQNIYERPRRLSCDHQFALNGHDSHMASCHISLQTLTHPGNTVDLILSRGPETAKFTGLKASNRQPFS